MSREQDLDRVLHLLDELAATHTAAALCIEELRDALRAVAGRPPARRPGGGRRGPLVDAPTFSVRWAGRACPLGRTYQFRLLERICRHPDRYFTQQQLLGDVWEGVRSPDTVRSTVRHLRARLRAAGMHDLAAAIRCNGGCCGLMLHPPG